MKLYTTIRLSKPLANNKLSECLYANLYNKLYSKYIAYATTNVINTSNNKLRLRNISLSTQLLSNLNYILEDELILVLNSRNI